MLMMRSLFAIHICFVVAYSSTIEDNVRLRRDLLANYDSEIRPPRNHSKALVVNVAYYLKAIIEVDDVKSIFKAYGSTVLLWTDERLTWDPQNYSGIEHFVSQMDHIWTPTAYTLNAVSTAFNSDVRNYPLRVYYNGYVAMAYVDVVETSFSSDMTYFPFDKQRCSIQMVLAAYLPEEVYLVNYNDTVDTGVYTENNEWKIDYTAVKPLHFGNYSGAIEFEFVLCRRHLFMTINMLTPVIMLVIVGPTILLLPVESGERVSFTVTILLAFGVFLANIGDHLPEASNPMSYLSYYLMICMICSSFLTMFTMFTTYIYFKENSQPVPRWVIFTLNLLSLSFVKTICFCKFSKNKKTHAESYNTKCIHGKNIKLSLRDEQTRNNSTSQITWKIVARRLDNIAYGYLWIGIICLFTHAAIIVHGSP